MLGEINSTGAFSKGKLYICLFVCLFVYIIFLISPVDKHPS